jgi:hypothetical protein
MGTWGTGPFDSDSAADFVDALDAAGAEARLELVSSTLHRMARSTGRIDDGAEGIAAAALVASQCPGGERYAADDDAPTRPLPTFPTELRAVAAAALTRALDQDSGVSDGWVDPGDAAAGGRRSAAVPRSSRTGKRWHGSSSTTPTRSRSRCTRRRPTLERCSSTGPSVPEPVGMRAASGG